MSHLWTVPEHLGLTRKHALCNTVVIRPGNGSPMAMNVVVVGVGFFVVVRFSKY